MAIITTSVGRIAVLALLAFGRTVLGGPIPVDIRGDVIISIPNSGHTHTESSNTITGSAALETKKMSAEVNNVDKVPPQWHLHNVPPFTKHHANTADAKSTVFAKVSKTNRAHIGAGSALEPEQPTAVKRTERSEARALRLPAPTQSAVDHITPIPGGPWKYREIAKIRDPAKHRMPVPVHW